MRRGFEESSVIALSATRIGEFVRIGFLKNHPKIHASKFMLQHAKEIQLKSLKVQ